MIEHKVNSKGSLLMGLECGNVVTKSCKIKGFLVAIVKLDKGTSTYRCQCNERIVNRYGVVPVLKVREQHGWDEYENDNGGSQVYGDLRDQVKFWRHPVAVR